MSSSASSSSSSPPPTWACIELGGTTIKVALAEGDPTNVVQQHSFPTGSDPAAALDQAIKFFSGRAITAYAVGSFGPVDLDPASRTYGFITSTPKAAWRNFDVLSRMPRGVPCGWNTDVNTAAFGELVCGDHGADVKSLAYVTVGTGIGAGLVVNGAVLTGLLHPEAGHVIVRRHKDEDPSFRGVCPFHGDCLEGLASAPACAARLGLQLEDLASLPDSHPVWELESFYLAQLCLSLTLIASPHAIVLGGGVLHRASLFPRIRGQFAALLNGYVTVPRLASDRFIVPSKWDAPGSLTSAGCVGTLAFAKHTWEMQQAKERAAQGGAVIAAGNTVAAAAKDPASSSPAPTSTASTGLVAVVARSTAPSSVGSMDESLGATTPAPAGSVELSEASANKLKMLNRGVAILFGVVSLLLLIDACLAGKRGRAPVYGIWWYRTETGFESTLSVIDSGARVGFLSFVFTALAAIDHTLTGWFMRGTYEAGLRQGHNNFRWIEYSVSASIMNILIALESGVLDVLLLLAVGALTATCMIFGAIGERCVDRKQFDLVFWAGCIPFLAAWAILLSQFLKAVALSDNRVPNFVYAIVFTLLVLEIAFGVNQIRPVKSYIQREVAYVLLSPTAKLLLAGLTYGGVRSLPSE